VSLRVPTPPLAITGTPVCRQGRGHLLRELLGGQRRQVNESIGKRPQLARKPKASRN
jgi:hypothetical protein